MLYRSVIIGCLLAAPVTASISLPHATALAEPSAGQPAREIEIIVAGGYKPDRIVIRAGERVRLKLLRKEHDGCTRELVIPRLSIRRELPPHQAVIVELPLLEPGEYEMRCGMNMIQGTLVVVAPSG